MVSSLLRETHVVGIQVSEMRRGPVHDLVEHGLRHLDAARAAELPDARDARRHTEHATMLQDGLDLGVGVAAEVIERDDGRHAELPDVLDVLVEVLETPPHGRTRSRVPRSSFGDAAVHLERAHRRHDHGGGGREPADAALDVEELLGAEVAGESRLGHHHVGVASAPGAWRSGCCSRARCCRTGRRGRTPACPRASAPDSV